MNTRHNRHPRSSMGQQKPFVSAGFQNQYGGTATSQTGTPQQTPSGNVHAVGQHAVTPIKALPVTTPAPVAAPVKIEVPAKPGPIESNAGDEMADDNNSMHSGTGGDDTKSNKPWYRNGNKKKPSVREKRIRRNRTLRKILTPKNALMALYELKGNKLSDYKIVADEKGFIAEVLVNNVRYEGRGISKISAKNSASEKALRDLIIQKMVLKPRSEMSAENKAAAEASTVDAGIGLHDDVEMADAEAVDGEEVPMMHLASFALHKLFTEWQAEGFEIPDFRVGHVPAGTNTAEKTEAQRKPIPERTELPVNAETMHPSMLLSVMRPASQYVELGTEGVTPNIIHGMGITVNGQQFVGAARSKKLARKAAAIQACNTLFNMSYERDDVVPTAAE